MSISFICPVHSCCGELVLLPESFPELLRFFPVADLRKSVECALAKGIGKPRFRFAKFWGAPFRQGESLLPFQYRPNCKFVAMAVENLLSGEELCS